MAGLIAHTSLNIPAALGRHPCATLRALQEGPPRHGPGARTQNIRGGVGADNLFEGGSAEAWIGPRCLMALAHGWRHHKAPLRAVRGSEAVRWQIDAANAVVRVVPEAQSSGAVGGVAVRAGPRRVGSSTNMPCLCAGLMGVGAENGQHAA
ncbi:hypothetical protein CYMTET_19219 [Cymbomonas tetramitiformis]|uniref:Uncharacterized protein n=1 Tax=Cymbomonas tetramitiformis TaxID=36881 RepID=A0AAE0G6H8_9CHLO|nr:hypothetical protein CYMTET_19219 [Cymbomonas tetramitiformis]